MASPAPTPTPHKKRRVSLFMDSAPSAVDAEMEQRVSVPVYVNEIESEDAPGSPKITKNLFGGGFDDSSDDEDEDQNRRSKEEISGRAPRASHRGRSRQLGQSRATVTDVARIPITPMKASRVATRRRSVERIRTTTTSESPQATTQDFESPVKRVKVLFPSTSSPVADPRSPPSHTTPDRNAQTSTHQDRGKRLSMSSTISMWSPWASPVPGAAKEHLDGSNAVFKSPPPRTPHKQCTPTPLRQKALVRKEVLKRITYPTEPQDTEPSSFEDFEMVEWLGTGVTAEVMKVFSPETKQHYAVKKSKHELRSEREREMLLQEVNIPERLASEGASFDHIVRYHQAWQQDGYLYIMMELCGGGTLRNFVSSFEEKRVPEEYVWTIINHVAKGLNVLHEHNIVHLDVKPENIFVLSDGTLKLGDFGIAVDGSKPSKQSLDFEGDSAYMAKELLAGTERTSSADVFSLGIMIYEFATGMELPTSGDTWHELREGKLGVLSPDYSSRLQSIILKMMDKDPVLRPSAAHILEDAFVEASWAPANLLVDFARRSPSVARAKPKQAPATRLSCSETPRKPRLSLTLFAD